MTRFFRGKETLLWWLHSGYALLFGIGIMWLSSRSYTYLRLIVFHITFIWLTSLFLPALVNRPWLSPKWGERMRLVINYFNKNFYQQLLFFLLPIYYASTTFGSRNMVFLVLLALSAILSTLDIVYDRFLSVRWQMTALFFMFNLFASINVMLPVLWSISNHWALRISAVLALARFASMLYRLSGLRGHSAKLLLGAAACALLLIITVFTPYIPPAPLSLANAEFGRSIRSLAQAADWLIAALALGALTVINCLGVKAGSTAQSILMVLKIVAIASLVVCGLLLGGKPTSAPPFAGPLLDRPVSFDLLTAVGAAMVPVLFAYGGWQTACFIAGEVREPRKNMPRGLIIGVVGVIALYLGVNFACVRVLGASGLAATTTPATDVMRSALGDTGARLIAAGIAISTLGFLSQSMLTAPRVYYAMAQDGLFSKSVGWIHPRTRVPAIAILLRIGRIACFSRRFLPGAHRFSPLLQ